MNPQPTGRGFWSQMMTPQIVEPHVAFGPGERAGSEDALTRSRSLFPLLVVLLLASGISRPAAAAPAQHGELSVVIGATSITATGITPGGKAVFFGVARIRREYGSAIKRIVGVAVDQHGDGTVTYEVAHVPRSSIWAVVDLKTGRYGVTGAGGVFVAYPPAPLQPLLRHDASGKVNVFALDHPVLDLLYVHPGLGAWTVTAAQDGGSHDTDGPNGVTAVTLSGATQVADGPQTVSEVTAGGTAIAIDWYKMQVVAFRIDQAMIAGAP